MAASKKTGTYEAMFLFPAGSAADVEGAITTARGIVERHGGEIIVIKKWDERRLAYELGKQKRGLYVICYYRGPGASVSAIEHDVNLSEAVLRVMIVKADHLNEEEMKAVEPQPVEKERPRDDRFGGFGDRPPREEGDRGDRPARAPRPRREEAEAPAASE
jgi:small subunit ribosomal protein S6